MIRVAIRYSSRESWISMLIRREEKEQFKVHMERIGAKYRWTESN